MSHKTFDGQSATGNFQEALSDATNLAEQSLGVADKIVHWELEKVKGEKGGIQGRNNITVTIKASAK